jgi:hypothetical protein
MELWFHLRRYEQPHTIGGPAEQQKTNGRLTVARSSSNDNDPPLRVAELQQRWPQGERRCNLALAHADARGVRTSTKSRRPEARMVAVIPSATGLLEPPPPRHRRQGPSAHRQIPTRILPDERGTDLRAEAPHRCKGRAAPEHERRPGSA